MGARSADPTPDVTILPLQASRIAAIAIQTGAAIGVSQSGSTLTIDVGPETGVYVEGHPVDTRRFRIDAQGQPIKPQEETLC